MNDLDRIEIVRLAKVVTPISSDITSIYNLYCKYVKPNAPIPSVNARCSSCGNSITKYWRELLEWYNKNN